MLLALSLTPVIILVLGFYLNDLVNGDREEQGLVLELACSFEGAFGMLSTESMTDTKQERAKVQHFSCWHHVYMCIYVYSKCVPDIHLLEA